MPIYAYRCQSCGFAKDVLQKVSDPVLTDCPECGKSSFAKQLTAAGFQLKGTGWYVTDFKNGSSSGQNGQKSGSSAGSAKPADTAASSPSSSGEQAA